MDRTFLTSNPSKQIVDLLTLIYKKGLTTSSGGNISIKDEVGNIYITPSYIDKGSLSETDICIITPDNNVKGIHPPSSELSFHKEIYKVREDVRCIIHAHPPALVSYSLRNKIPNSKLIFSQNTKSELSVFADYEIPGSDKLSKNLAGEFKKGFNSVIMENHGAVSGGENPLVTLSRFESLEYLCESEINATILSNEIDTPDYSLDNLKQFSYLMQEYSVPSKGNKTGDKLCKYINRAYYRNILFNPFTSFSAREDEETFLINSNLFPPWEIKKDDLVAISNNIKEETELTTIHIHNSIYNRNTEINSIIIGQPSSLMAFAIAHINPVADTIPESYIFLRDAITISHMDLTNDVEILAKFINKHKLIIVENMFVISAGATIFEAFNRMEVAEYNAKSILADYLSTNISLLNKNQIKDLDEKYF